MVKSIEEMRKLAGEATPGPWTTERPEKDADGWAQGVAVAATYGRQMIYANPPGGSFPAADQCFIAAANPSQVIHFCDLIEAQAKENAELREALKKGRWYAAHYCAADNPNAPIRDLENTLDLEAFDRLLSPSDSGRGE